MKYRVNGEPGLVRDSVSRAILFTENEQMRAYEKRKKHIEMQNDEINNLKQEVAELKTLIHRFIERQENR
jgi:hypothetical protein